MKKNRIICPIKNLKNLGVPTIKLAGVLITKPTVQYVSPERVVVHLLISTQEDYRSYQQDTIGSFNGVEMPPAHHVLLLTEQSSDFTFYTALKKRTKVSVECMNVAYHNHDCQGKAFNTHRLLVIGLDIMLSNS